jgi:hypothetical protein
MARLTPRVRHLVTRDYQHRLTVGRLTPAQVETLIAVARTPDAFAEDVSASRAIQALARGATGDVSLPVLARVVSDNAAPSVTRVVAAREIGLIGTPDAEQTLRRRIGVGDPRVLQEVLAGLGALGGPPALRTLARVAMPDDDAARRQLIFARALIAHRHAIEGDYLPASDGRARPPQELGSPSALTMAFKTAAATAKDRERLRGTTFGIELGPCATDVACGHTEWTVFFNRELEPRALGLRLLERPWIVALLAQWHVQSRIAIGTHVLLARPEGRSVRLEIVRTDGERVYTGSAEPRDTDLTFTIADLDQPGAAPTTVTGRLSARGLTLDRVVVAGRRVVLRASDAVARYRTPA